MTTRKPIEIRITNITIGYEICLVFGLLDTYTIQRAFPTRKLAREWVKSQYGDSHGIPVICQ